MRYSISARVDGNVSLDEPGIIKRDEFIIDLRTDSNNKLKEIAISIKVPEEKLSSMKTTVERGDGDDVPKFNIGGDNELFDRLVKELQYIESDLAFVSFGSLQKIHWENPSNLEFIHENEEDYEIPTMSLHGLKKSYPKKQFHISKKSIASMLEDSSRSSRLRIAKSFWRDGLLHLDQFKYIQAFYSFYFIIEDYYAGGKTSEKEVIKQFDKSQEFQKISKLSFNSVSKTPRHKENLEKLFNDEGLDIDQEGLGKMLFRIRGKLHHYSSKSSKKQGTPFNQKDFESVALLVMHMATVCIQTNDPSLRKKRTKPIKSPT